MLLKTGDPCPCCGRPLTLTDPAALQLLGILAEVMGFPRKMGTRLGQDRDREGPGDEGKMRCDNK